MDTLTMHDIPTEIFHHILDQFGCGEEDYLATCTLVCRDWLEISRQHLFSEVHVLRGRDESYEDLAEFLEAHPTIAGYIRTLSLEAKLFTLPARVSIMPVISADLLYRIVRSVPNIHALRLRQLNIAPPRPRGDGDAPRISIEHVEYDKCHSDVVTTFAFLALFQLEHLDFEPLFEDVDLEDFYADCRPLDVLYLCVDPGTPQPVVAFKALQQVVPPKMLKSFRYPSSGIQQVPPPVCTFLRDVGQNIVDLDLSPSAQDDYLVLPQLPSLKVFRYNPGISLLASPETISDDHSRVIPFRDSWIPHLPDDLDKLILYISYGDLNLTPSAATMPLWDLEKAFVRFPSLCQLMICFPDLPVTPPDALAVCAVCFPDASAKGILEVTVRDWDMECREWDLYGYLRDDC